MNLVSTSHKMLQRTVGLLLWMAIPLVAVGQHKPSAPAAPHAAAPAQHASAPQSHAPQQSHPQSQTRPNTGARPGNQGASRPGNTSRPGSTTGQNHGTGKPNPQQGQGNKNTQQGRNQQQGNKNQPGNKNPQQGKNQPAGKTQGGNKNPVRSANYKPGSHAAPGKNNVALKGGGKGSFRPNGQVRSFNKNGMHMERNLHGGRTVVRDRGGVRTASFGRGRGGYKQSHYMDRGGRHYYSRTYYSHGGYHSGVYRGYHWHGHDYYGYNRPYFYHAGFYGWAYNPWAVPVYYGWGWGGAPWYGYYGFTPYATYAGPAFWLTDYLIAANLQGAYAAAAQDAPPAEDVPAGITVAANQPWNDSGMQMVRGQTYRITASGVANYGPGELTPMGDGRPVCNASALAPGLPCLALVGKIGPSGIPFYVGPAKRFVAPVDGELYLSMNDSYFPDNSGAWAVTINGPGGNPDNGSGGGAVAQSGSDAVTLTPEVKEAIAAEVKAEIEAARKESGSGSGGDSPDGGQPQQQSDEVPPALKPAQRTFVVNADLAVVADGEECALTQGDILTRLGDTPDADDKVSMSVAGSKAKDCAAGSNVMVAVDDLQEMMNHFQEQVDEGLKTLASKQGTGGLPKAPDASTQASNIPPAPVDKTAGQAVDQQETEADQTEAQVKNDGGASGGGGLQ